MYGAQSLAPPAPCRNRSPGPDPPRITSIAQPPTSTRSLVCSTMPGLLAGTAAASTSAWRTHAASAKNSQRSTTVPADPESAAAVAAAAATQGVACIAAMVRTSGAANSSTKA